MTALVLSSSPNNEKIYKVTINFTLLSEVLREEKKYTTKYFLLLP